jgi:cation:H+ antiporter
LLRSLSRIETLLSFFVVLHAGSTLIAITVSVALYLVLKEGNASGSIVANIGLMAATLLLLARRRVRGTLVLPSALAAGTAVVALASVAFVTSAVSNAGHGSIPRAFGIACLVVLPIYLFFTYRQTGSEPSGPQPSSSPARAATASLLRVIIGALVVVETSRILVPIVVELSRRAGLPESLIASTLVAVGTSLPELSTSVAAARRSEIELGLGNIAGGNVMNVPLVVGLSAVVSGSSLTVDLYLLGRMVLAAVVLSVALVLCFVIGRGSRVVGPLFLIGYGALVSTGLAGLGEVS